MWWEGVKGSKGEDQSIYGAPVSGNIHFCCQILLLTLPAACGGWKWGRGEGGGEERTVTVGLRGNLVWVYSFLMPNSTLG